MLNWCMNINMYAQINAKQYKINIWINVKNYILR